MLIRKTLIVAKPVIAYAESSEYKNGGMKEYVSHYEIVKVHICEDVTDKFNKTAYILEEWKDNKIVLTKISHDKLLEYEENMYNKIQTQ